MNPDFSELLLAFNAQHVEYLLVGAHALAVYGHVRATKDIDVWVRPDSENARKVLLALSAFGAPLGDLNQDEFNQLADAQRAAAEQFVNTQAIAGQARARELTLTVLDIAVKKVVPVLIAAI